MEKVLLERAKFCLQQEIQCIFFIVTNYNYTAQLLGRYICIKLKQGFTLNQVIRPLIDYFQKLIKKKNLCGYRLELAGRFSRKQRATYLLFKGGTVPLGTVKSKIDFGLDVVILKDGVGSIKVWLNYPENFKKSVISLKN